MLAPATWYIPPTCTRPSHLPPAIAAIRHTGDTGPAGLPPGGLLLGGALVDDIRWIALPAGYAIAAEAPVLASLLRSERPQSEEVTLADGSSLRVPLLLDGDLGYRVELIHRLPFLDKGTIRIAKTIEHQALADRIAAFVRQVQAGDSSDLDDDGIWQLAIDLLTLVYHLTRDEVITWQLLRDDDPVVVCIAAGGYPQAAPDEPDNDEALPA